jgi:hypothetical protein
LLAKSGSDNVIPHYLVLYPLHTEPTEDSFCIWSRAYNICVQPLHLCFALTSLVKMHTCHPGGGCVIYPLLLLIPLFSNSITHQYIMHSMIGDIREALLYWTLKSMKAKTITCVH